MPDSWYEADEPIRSDPFDLITGFLASGWFNPSPPTQAAAGTKAFISISKTQYDLILAQGANGGLLDTVKLTDQQAKSIRAVLSLASDTATVPLVTQNALALLSTFLIDAAGGLVTGGFFSYLFDQLQTIAVKAQLLQHVIAAGGNINHVLSAYQTNQRKERLVNTFQYQVQIGSEVRNYLLCAFTYPVKWLFKDLRTAPGNNQKIITPYVGSTWRTLDVESGTYDNPNWIEVNRDDDFIYFIEDDPNPGLPYRVSYRGGPLQHKKQDGQWGTLYAQVAAT